MPGCVLHVVGQVFDPEPVLAGLSLRPYAVFRKGDKRFPNNPRSKKVHDDGGFKCDVNSVDDDLAGQVKDAIAFLSQHFKDLAQLASVPAIEDKYLDFGYACRLDCECCCVQCDYLPPELLRLCGDLGIGIELSLYPRIQAGA
jgi:hypothetical protein